MAGLYSHTTRASGLTLTANIYNADHQNHIDNHDPEQIDDYSPDNATFQTMTDPYPTSSESLPTTLAGELERIRYQLDQIIGGSQWYHDMPATNGDLTTISTSIASLDSSTNRADMITQIRMLL
tara:strand:- start:955 stop:1326 length:372 start_codon:yes stop_codon:yes gene_type:complete